MPISSDFLHLPPLSPWRLIYFLPRGWIVLDISQNWNHAPVCCFPKQDVFKVVRTVACDSHPVPFTGQQSPSGWMEHDRLSRHQLADGPRGCFHLSAIVNNAATNTELHF